MNLTQRFTLLVKGSLNSVFDSLEDPERSLYQLVLEMEEQLEAAKRAAAQAMANEDRVRARIATHREDAQRWEAAARRSLAKGQEADASEAVRQAELAGRQGETAGRNSWLLRNTTPHRFASRSPGSTSSCATVGRAFKCCKRGCVKGMPAVLSAG